MVKLADLSGDWLRAKLDGVQAEMFQRAAKFRDENTRRASSYDELKSILAEQGGFVRCFFEPGAEAEAAIKGETKATVRCIPLDTLEQRGKCIYSGKQDAPEVIFAIAY